MRKEKLDELKQYIEELKTVQWCILEREAKFLRVEAYNCTLNNDQVIYREKLVKGKNTGSSAIVLPVLENGEVLLTVEPRVFTKRTVGIGIPAGYIEEKEKGYQAALRELKEETGYVPGAISYLGGFYQDMGCSSAYNESFIAFDCVKKYSQNTDPGEFIKYFNCSYDEALELIDLGYIEGCNAIITLQRAKTYLKGR